MFCQKQRISRMTPYIEKETSSPKIGRVYLQKELEPTRCMRHPLPKFLFSWRVPRGVGCVVCDVWTRMNGFKKRFSFDWMKICWLLLLYSVAWIFQFEKETKLFGPEVVDTGVSEVKMVMYNSQHTVKSWSLQKPKKVWSSVLGGKIKFSQFCCMMKIIHKRFYHRFTFIKKKYWRIIYPFIYDTSLC